MYAQYIPRIMHTARALSWFGAGYFTQILQGYFTGTARVNNILCLLDTNISMA